ncbi:MAG: hypothetical protein V4753_01925 [Pseudomonadota bacterium]
MAGKQIGPADEGDLFQEAIRIVDQARPKTLMPEHVTG